MENILSGFLFLLAHIIVIGKITTSDSTSPNSDQWSPVLKIKNSTRDWKVSHKGPSSNTSPSSSSNQDQQAAATLRRFTIPTDHGYEKADPHYRPYYDDLTIPHMIPRYEPSADADGYYYPSYAPSPPAYGPPPTPTATPTPTPLPDDSIYIELAFSTLVVRCVAHDPLEHIVWTRYACPNEYYYGTGTVVAEGSVVENSDLYSVHIVGDDGDIASELLLKTPLDDSSTGLYVCEAWPHYVKPTDGYGHYYPPTYPSLTDAFIIGGSELLDQCYFGPKSPFPHRPFPYKTRKEDAGEKHDDKTILTKKQSDQKVSADALRKPRTLVKPVNGEGRQNSISEPLKTNATNLNVKAEPTTRRQTPLYKTGAYQRYDFKFDNSTKLRNASVADVFKHFGWRVSNKNETQHRNVSRNAVTVNDSNVNRDNHTSLIQRTDVYHRAINESQSNGRLNWKFLNNNNNNTQTTNTTIKLQRKT